MHSLISLNDIKQYLEAQEIDVGFTPEDIDEILNSTEKPNTQEHYESNEYRIDLIIQKLNSVSVGRASSEYKNEILNELKNSFTDEAQSFLLNYTNNGNPPKSI